MEFNPPLQEAILIKRYKRFLADVETSEGEVFTLHCPNTGSMKNCQTPGSRIWYSTSDNQKGKYPHTWELVESLQRHLVGINTLSANRLVNEALDVELIAELRGYTTVRREVPYGEERSRIDFLLSCESDPRVPDCYVEVKNVSLGMGDGLGLFPDAVTARGQKHLRELMEMKSAGKRAVLLFCVQHSGVDRLQPADSIDPDYGKLLREAEERGVELLAYAATVSPHSIQLDHCVPVQLPDLNQGTSD